MKKWFFKGLLLSVGISLLGGCMLGRKEVVSQEKVLQYMSERYDDTFEWKTGFSGTPGVGEYQIVLTCGKYPGKDINLNCLVADHSMDIMDNYIAVKYEAETRNLITKTLTSLYGDDLFLIFKASGSGLPKRLTKDSTFEEYISSTSYGITFFAIVYYDIKKNGAEFEIDRFEKALAYEKFYCHGSLVFETDKSNVRELNPESYYIDYLQYKTFDIRLDFDYSNEGMKRDIYGDGK